MRFLYSNAIRFPRATIAVAVLVTLAVAPGLLRLRLRTDGHALVPADAPAVVQDEAIRAEFGLDDPVVVVIHADHADGIFNVHTLRLVDRLTQSLAQIEGIRPERVLSLATEASDRVWPGTLRFRRLLEPMPETPAELRRLRRDLAEIALYSGTFVSRDGTSAAILVGVPPGRDRLELLQQIHGVIDDLGRIPESIDVIGAPVAEALLGTHILEDLGVPAKWLGFRTFDDRPTGPPESQDDVSSNGDGRQASDGGTLVPALDRARTWIARNIGLVPLAIAMMALVFLACFRSLAATALPLIEVGAALVFVFGVMGFLDIPIYLTTAILPIIITATGITDEIHVFTRYRQLLHENPDADPAPIVRQALDELARPIALTSVTTSLAFLSFATSSIGPVRAFGIFTAVGSIFCMLWSLSVVPACFVLMSPSRFVAARRRGAGQAGPVWQLCHAIGRFIPRARIPVLLLVGAVIATTPLGIRRVVVQDSWIDGFAENSPFRRATQDFNDRFLGMHVLMLAVDGGAGKPVAGELPATAVEPKAVQLPTDVIDRPESLAGWRLTLQRTTPARAERDWRSQISPRMTASTYWIESAHLDGERIVVELKSGRPSPLHLLRLQPDETVRFELSPAPLMRPDALDRLADLERFIARRTDDAVGGVLGPSDYVRTVNFMIHGRRPLERRIPRTPAQIERVWREYGNIRGEARVGQLVNPTYTRGVITILLKNANFIDTARLMSAIREYEAEHLVPHDISLTFAGDVAVSQTLIEAIVRTEVQSLMGTLVGVLLVTTLIGRSLIFGLLCMIPSGIAVAINFAFMGFSGMPLGVATSMFSAMTIGIGVDYAIHLQSRLRRLRAGGLAAPQAIAGATAGAGSAIFVDTLAVALGFGILTLSQVPANARLGALVALSIVNCFLVTILVLPAVLSLTRPNPTAPLPATDAPA